MLLRYVRIAPVSANGLSSCGINTSAKDFVLALIAVSLTAFLGE
jgi:hypothetical protein